MNLGVFGGQHPVLSTVLPGDCSCARLGVGHSGGKPHCPVTELGEQLSAEVVDHADRYLKSVSGGGCERGICNDACLASREGHGVSCSVDVLVD